MPKKKKDTLKKVEAKTAKILIITLALMILVLGSTFFFYTSQGAQNGYALEQEKEKNENLKKQFLRLQTKIIDSTSFKNIKESDIIKSMIQESKKIFITEKDLSLQ